MFSYTWISERQMSRRGSTSRLMKTASLGYRERAGVGIEVPLDADSE